MAKNRFIPFANDCTKTMCSISLCGKSNIHAMTEIEFAA